MALSFVYDQSYKPYGWWDDGGLSRASWFDEALTETPILLHYANTTFFQNISTIYDVEHTQVEVLTTFFEDPDIFFPGTRGAILTQGEQMIRNEVRRIR